MKKKKLLLPLAVLTLSCGLTAGVLTGCGGHKHEFTEWAYDESGHWQVCVEDDEKSEKKDHVFGEDGKCECGAEEEKVVYGTASGKVKLYKFGEYLTDYTGVTVDLGDDDVEIDYDDETGEFEISNAVVGKSYPLVISKTGYLSYTTTLEVVEGENSVVGGEGCVLHYEVFGTLVGYDTELHDFSQANDGKLFVNGNGKQSLNVISKDAYTDFSATIRTNAKSGGSIQGVAVKFADGSYAIFNIHVDQKDLQFRPDLWGMKSVWGNKIPGTDKDQWFEFKNVVTDADLEKFNGDGLDVTLERKGGILYAYIDGRYIDCIELPADRAADQVNVGFFSFDAKPNGSWDYELGKTTEDYSTELNISANEITGASVVADKTGYQLGETVELTVTIPEHYVLTSLLVNGANAVAELKGGKLTFKAKKTNTVTAVFEEVALVDVSVAVTGKKYGVTGNSLEGKEVTLQGQGGLSNITFTVTEGKFVKADVPKGTYTAVAAGYLSAEVVVGTNGIERAIALEYDTFGMAPANFDSELHDFSQQNDGKIKVNGNGDKTLDIVSKDSYGDVSATITVNGKSGGDIQGILFGFEDGSYAVFNFHKGQRDLQFRPVFHDYYAGMESVWGKKKADGSGDNWIEFKGVVTDADLEKFNGAGLEVTLVRQGGMLYAYIEERLIGSVELPEERKDDQIKVGFFAFGVKANAEWDFAISTQTPDYSSTVQLTANVPDPEVEGIEVQVDKTACRLGETVTLTVKHPDDYVVTELIVNGENVLDRLEHGVFKFSAVEANTVTVTVVKMKTVTVSANVTGKKYGVTGNALEGETVTLTRGEKEFSALITDGAIEIEEVPLGVYTVSVEGYRSVNVTVGENGLEDAITLEYDAFGMLPPKYDAEKHDFSQINDGIIKVNGSGGQSLDIVTKDSYGNVAVTIRTNGKSGGDTQGIVLGFEDGSYAIFNVNTWQKDLQFRPNLWGMKSVWGEKKPGTNDDQWFEFKGVVTDADLGKFNGDGLEITLVRKDGTLYTFIDGRFINKIDLPEARKNDEVKVGFFSTNVKANAEWAFEITETLPSLESATELTKNVPDGAEGIEIELDQTSCTLGDTLTLTVTLPAEGYVVSALTVNGTSMINELANGTLTFQAMLAQNEVIVTVVERRFADVEVSVTGKKFDVKGNSLEGKEIVLKGQGGLEDVTVTVTDGKIEKQGVVQGTYAVEAEGYKSVSVEVGAQGISSPIVLEYADAFSLVQGWGTKNLDQQNDGYLKGSNESEQLLTNAQYQDVAVTIYLSGAYDSKKIDGGNQGIAVRFDGGGYVLIRMEKKIKIQFAEPDWWQNGGKAEGAGWNDLIFFEEGDEYLKAYERGELKLTLVRNGASFYAYLNDEYIGRQTVNAKYANLGAQVGIYWAETENGANKTWQFEMTDKIPEFAITNGTAEGANGSVTGIPQAAVKTGDSVNLTITPDEGYILKTLTVGGKDVTSSIVFNKTTFIGTYQFTVTGDTEVTAEFEVAKYGNVEAAVSGTKYGVSDALDLNGLKVTLSNQMTEYTTTIAEGKLTQANVLTGTYVLTAEGFVSQQVTVTESGLEPIVFVWNVFTSESDSADLSGISQGKVTATGKGGVSLTTIEKYTDVVAEAQFDLVNDFATTQRRYSVSLVFGDNKAFRVDLDLHEGDRHIVQETQWETMMGFNWGAAKEYTADEVAAFSNVTFKLERIGAEVKISVNGELIKTYTLPDEYATQEAQIKFIFDSNNTDGSQGFTFEITASAATASEQGGTTDEGTQD